MMSEYLSPGVYVEEVPSGRKPVEAVSTSNAGFIGVTAKGPVDCAKLVTSWNQFEKEYGGLYSPNNLGYAVKQFFDEGGAAAYISRIVPDGNRGLVGLSLDDYIGSRESSTGLYAFNNKNDINIIAVPPEAHFSVSDIQKITKAGLDYCSSRKDCFFVADIPRQLENDIPAMLDYRKPFDTSYGAVYTPWLKIHDPLTGEIKDIPPSGAVAGKYVYTDINRGVYKAPAGLNYGILYTATDVKTVFTSTQQDILYPKGINAIRKFKNSGIVIWGTRTLSRDPEWKYVPVRRLSIMIKESIEKGTRWAVFEPNGAALWGRIRESVCEFLLNQWRNGVLMGTTPDEAFFVKCDQETNPPEAVDNGRVNIAVGFAPLKPAEFIILKIAQNCKDTKV